MDTGLGDLLDPDKTLVAMERVIVPEEGERGGDDSIFGGAAPSALRGSAPDGSFEKPAARFAEYARGIQSKWWKRNKAPSWVSSFLARKTSWASSFSSGCPGLKRASLLAAFNIVLQVVGQAGVLTALLMVGLCLGVTLPTSLSMSAIATNGITHCREMSG